MLIPCWWECILVQPLWKAIWSFLKEVKTEILFNPANSLLGIYPKKYVNHSTKKKKKSCSHILNAALFTIENSWTQPRCPLLSGLNKENIIHTHQGHMKAI